MALLRQVWVLRFPPGAARGVATKAAVCVRSRVKPVSHFEYSSVVDVRRADRRANPKLLAAAGKVGAEAVAPRR